MRSNANLPILGATMLIAACATLPSGPSVVVMPGTGKTFDAFQADDRSCRAFSHSQAGGKTAQQAATESVQKSALTGAALGAAFGAAVGGGEGAAVGAASGLLVGGAVGNSAGLASAGAVQQQYDAAFIQCMYAKGNRVPVSGQLANEYSKAAYPPPPPLTAPPPAADFYPLPPADFSGTPPDFTETEPPGT